MMNSIILSNGVEMPSIGLGTFPLFGDVLTKTVSEAFNIGYRLIDTADNYYNEKDLGESLDYLYSHSSASRKDMFLVSKISDDLYPQGTIDAGNNMGKYFWKSSSYMQENQAVKKIISQRINESLSALHTDYLDLWLMHWPYPDYFEEIWYEMEQLYKEGKVRAIGLCNSRERHFETLKRNCSVFPHVNQIETSPLNAKSSLLEYCNANNVKCMVYSPLKNLSFHVCEKYDAYVENLAKKYNKSREQIVLKFHVQRGTIPIPKSTHASRLKKNFNIFEFEISDQEMKDLLAFNMDYQYMAESMRCPGL